MHRLLTAADVESRLPSLRTLLQSLVNDDPAASSIGFLAPLSDADADEYWRSVAAKLDTVPQTCYLFVVWGSDALDIMGTVQLQLMPKATHAHRAEIAKLLVRPSAQRRGLGRKMMDHVEDVARGSDIQLLTLDTKTETPARAFYERTGWTVWGTCPEYAAFADGRLGSTTFFYKSLK
ncbi:hypothetical protein M406DRAFT_64831 [Cryphonectria parasitica EP155]|uniref:N-acetyltransferase domain-containing protein n=1 Tax=Cryphonectria parasitica (strain ATCC 38755 / EP155) TaxID=660469 RepID=A0A9P5CKY8_CRYP1|nr:uncharacterized protein M406DRAFT_64831 [Cryphonectria parasitica EP155]KAF3761657.1 hypothetical protein M406DRAFT_64831 [Cryphonectria parasitica EP155]